MVAQEILEVMLLQGCDSSDSDSSDEDDDMEMLLVATIFPKDLMGPRLHLDDVDVDDCISLFR